MTTPILSRTNCRYGWRADLPDNRDLAFKPGRKVPKILPAKVDLRASGFMPPVYDQGELGSCTGNAIAGAFEFEQRRQGLTDYQPSRLFIYYEERKIEGDIGTDGGAQIRDGLKVVNHAGAPNENLWGYDVAKFADAPPADAYADGLKHLASGYASVDNTAMKNVQAALAAGVPVVFGFSVFQWFEDIGPNGVAKPVKSQRVLGGHAVDLVGYEKLPRSKTVYGIVRNSWGNWGEAGYCYIPLAWLCNLNNADDFWCVNQVTK
jgi:C1A family cysteine protease